jgi:hypothetical protein
MEQFYLQNYEQSDLSDFIKADKRLKDNFDRVFAKFYEERT